MDIDEKGLQDPEEVAPVALGQVLCRADQMLIRVIQALPDMNGAKLRSIFEGKPQHVH
jgi:hypothetical protein